MTLLADHLPEVTGTATTQVLRKLSFLSHGRDRPNWIDKGRRRRAEIGQVLPLDSGHATTFEWPFGSIDGRSGVVKRGIQSKSALWPKVLAELRAIVPSPQLP